MARARFDPESMMPEVEETPRGDETARPGGAATFSSQFNREQLVEALSYIDAQPYEQWLRVGMALHTLGEVGLEIWNNWSSTAANFDEDACRSKWQTFGRQEGALVTLGTIYFLAQQGGWRPVLPPEHFTDKGNAERLVRRFGGRVRYVTEYKKWIIWEGDRWGLDDQGLLLQFAKQVTEHMHKEARGLGDDQRQRMVRHALASEHINRLKAMVELAQTEPGIPISQCRLDRDQFKLNLMNGTLDLRTGRLHPHCKDDLITRMVMIESSFTEMHCPYWLAFLDRIFDGNKGLIRFIQKIIGYCLTGDTREQCLFFLYGTGANGKSTLLKIIDLLLNNYVVWISAEALMVKSQTGGATPEIARLKSARVVVTNEVEDGQRLAENTIKQMTGQDTIIARNLYANPFEFLPEFKLLIAGNHRPVIRGTDHAIWRRIHMIPFLVTIPPEEQDKGLVDKLHQELPGILQWAVKGCRLWLDEGLTPPDEVQAATQEYRAEMDTTGQWLDECCEVDSSAETTAQRLYGSYKGWCELNGHYPFSSKRLGMTLRERGFVSRKMPQATWVGIKVTRGG